MCVCLRSLGCFSALLRCSHSFPPRRRRWWATPRLTIPSLNMASGSGGGSPTGGNPPPKITKVQQLLAKNSSDGWEKCWKEGVTPWDLGQPTPVILHLVETGSLSKGRILIPGCGTGYDVVAIAGPERYAVGLDISEVAVKKAQELFAMSENFEFFTFVAADFFKWHPSELFDCMIDYTFFCAIDPSLRSSWASRVNAILKPDGELLTLIFPIEDYDGGPPYAVSLSAYEDALHPFGFQATCVVDNDLAIGPRKGREKLARWKRMTTQSAI